MAIATAEWLLRGGLGKRLPDHYSIFGPHVQEPLSGPATVRERLNVQSERIRAVCNYVYGSGAASCLIALLS